MLHVVLRSQVAPIEQRVDTWAACKRCAHAVELRLEPVALALVRERAFVESESGSGSGRWCWQPIHRVRVQFVRTRCLRRVRGDR